MSIRPSFLRDDYIPTLFQQITTLVRDSQALPSAEEQAYLQFSSEFIPRVGALRLHAKSVLMRLVKFVSPQCAAGSYDDVVDAGDECLENVSLALDSNSSDSIQSQLSMLSPSQLLKYNYPFLQSRDNSSSPFIPLLTHKPNAKIPLDPDLIALQRRPEIGKVYRKHPYQYELEQLQMTERYAEVKEPVPPCEFDTTPYEFVTTKDQLNALIEYLHGVTEIAIDLEHHSTRSYQGITCLMQISTRERDYVVDTLAVWEEMKGLLGVFTDPGIVKVMHGADSDVLWLQRDFGLYVVNMFDTGQAARELQYSLFSLAFLLKRLCHVDTDKSFQLADWRVRPLSSAMVKYARIDTHYLLYIYDRMKAELASKGKELHKDEKSMLSSVFARSKSICLKVYEKADYTYMGVRKVGSLGYHGKRLVDALAQWRDTLARKLDESPSYIMTGETVVILAATMPSSEEELKNRIRRPSPLLTSERIRELLSLIDTCRDSSLPQSSAPQPISLPNPSPATVSTVNLLLSSLLHTSPKVTVTVEVSEGEKEESWSELFERGRVGREEVVERVRLGFESLMKPVVRCGEEDMAEESGTEEGKREEAMEVLQPSTSDFIKLPPAPQTQPLPIKRKGRDRGTVHIVPDTPTLQPAPKLKLEIKTEVKSEPKLTKRRKLLRPS